MTDKYDRFRIWMLIAIMISMLADQRYITIGLIIVFFISIAISFALMIKELRK